MQTPARIGRVKMAAAGIAAGLLLGMWIWQPAPRAATGRYDLAISTDDSLRLQRAGAIDQVASTPNRTLACVSVMRFGFFNAGLTCVSTSAGMSARTMQYDRRSTN